MRLTVQKFGAALGVAAALVVAQLVVASADSLINKVLVGAGGIVAVHAIAKPLDDFINHLMLVNGVGNKDKTKVVPILTVGSATYVGAAQVSGPAGVVDRVQAVGSFAAAWNNNVWQVRALVPIDSLNPLKGFKRVYGVGVDAIINAKL